jgi:predicted O-linked N-acetylglucosamine transferase (SPINDLY family)
MLLRLLRQALNRRPGNEAADTDGAVVLAQRTAADPGLNESSLATLRVLLAQHPNRPEIRLALAQTLDRRKHLSEAIALYRELLALAPDDESLHTALGNCLARLGRITEALPHYRRTAPPSDPAAYSSVLGSLNYDTGLSPPAVFEEHRDWGARCIAAGGQAAVSLSNDRAPDRRLRIGYVSPDFRQHPVSHLFVPTLEQHDRGRFEIFCYHSHRDHDAVTAHVKGLADGWREVAGTPDADLRAQIRADRIDVLVDLAGHTTHGRVTAFAARSAPVQVSWLGYFNTTGLPTMDYFITDSHSSPPDQDRYFTERLVRLPHTRFCYQPPPFAPAIGPLPMLARGQVTFGCFNNIAKLNDNVLRLWARVLDAVPESRLEIRSIGLADAPNARRLRAQFTEHGVAPDRIALHPYSAQADLLGAYNGIDLALDPFPFGGGLTSLEALWMGVPVVTLAQAMIPGRQTLCFLRNTGLDECIAGDENAYVSIARTLAGAPATLADIRAALRPRMQASQLVDAGRYTRDLESAYRRMWHDWVAGA